MSKTALFIGLFFLLSACTTKTFKRLDGKRTGIHFNNTIFENDSINILDREYVYNGGGVAISDFNNDGLQDVFFTGNMVGNKLYLNKGNLRFEDVTTLAGVGATDRWNTGVATVDINNDGLMDIYVCASLMQDARKRSNMLFVNKGHGKDGSPVFVEEAHLYNIADTGHSTNAAFFDYDNDGDLDLYVLTNKMAGAGVYPNQYREKIIDGTSPNTDRLYQNNWDTALGHPVFTDVSAQAGILIEGYGLGLNISDINKDGWKDIYVTNDFLSNDLLWINNRNGTFTNKAGQYFKHTSYSAMGNDVVDINNDGLLDVIALDMLPGDNVRKKMMSPANAYQTYMNNEAYSYEYQYGRNTLQLNQGLVPGEHDSLTGTVFSDIGFYAGVAETDWSWTPLVSDFDNDGFRDIIITNGFPKDVTDRDFMTYRVNARSVASREEIIEQIPTVKLPNYAFRNNKDLRFADVTSQWGMSAPSFSNGAAYGDLDRDGDLDLVINNINDEAFIYENTSGGRRKDDYHYLQVKFKGDLFNRNGLGAWAEIYYDHGKQQVYENSPFRGYLSTVEAMAHFGLGEIHAVDSLVIRWPNGRKQVMHNVKVNQVVVADISKARESYAWGAGLQKENSLFKDVTASLGIKFKHQDIDFIDFNIQKLLPHKFSEYGPALAAGDVNGDGLDDIVIGGSMSYSPTVLIQHPSGSFVEKKVLPGVTPEQKNWEDLGITLFDADNDGDMDLYTASGGYERERNSESYADKLYINNGRGDFSLSTNALPPNLASKSCVRVADYDRDGDLDLFLGGRVEPGYYPKPVSSFIYRNDSKRGAPKFTDVTAVVAGSLINIGLVCDAVFTDFDDDGWQDLLLAGEWMPLTFLKNNSGVFTNTTAASGISNKSGWWNSLLPGDFDSDGDVDYIAGNLGLNSFYRASEEHPVKIYAKDFDENGSYDAVPTLFLPVSQNDKTKKEFPAHVRDDMTKQMVMFRAKFQNYSQYANAPFEKMFTDKELLGALELQANYFGHGLVKNNGGGKFELLPLPGETQYSCINGMLAEDFDGDGNLDVLISGNDYGAEVSIGRYDACNGLVLRGNGRGGFVPLSIAESGWFVPGNGKAVVKLRGSTGQTFIAASQNKGPLKVFSLTRKTATLILHPSDASMVITYKNGKKQKREIGYGSSFLSQSGRYLNLDNNITAVEIRSFQGRTRSVNLQEVLWRSASL